MVEHVIPLAKLLSDPPLSKRIYKLKALYFLYYLYIIVTVRCKLYATQLAPHTKKVSVLPHTGKLPDTLRRTIYILVAVGLTLDHNGTMQLTFGMAPNCT